MASERLFGVNIMPACRYCEFVMQSFDNNKVLCHKHGVVLATYRCRSFIYDPIKRVPHRPKTLEKIGEAEFML